MTELEKIQEAFHDNCHAHVTELIETFEDGSSMKRRICNDGYHSFIVRLETQKKKAWYPFFRKGHDLSSICDFIVFVELADEVYALLVEMKLGGDNPKPQLDFSENFVKFVLRRMMLTDKLGLEKPIYIRKIGLTDSKPPKNLTKMKFETSPFYDDNNFMKRYKEDNFRIRPFVTWPTRAKNQGLVSLYH